MNWEQVLFNLGGAGAVIAALLSALRSPRARAAVGRLFADTNKFEESLSALRSVVEAQGESIEWLREELDRTRGELDAARERLASTDNLAAENAKLRARVAELESHVQRLEEELRRRRGGRPRKTVEE